MFCSKCGNEIPEGAKFCDRCGAKVGAEETISVDALKNKAASYAEKAESFIKNSDITGERAYREEKAAATAGDPGRIEDVFVEPDEKLLGKLGNDYLVNLLFHKVKKCNALLTDKRVYLKGTFYTGEGKTIFKMSEERILDLEDVTGTGFIYVRFSRIMLLLGILSTLFGGIFSCIGGSGNLRGLGFLVLIAGIILLVRAFTSRKVFFFIDYAGGYIKIDAKLIGMSDVQDFHKQMRRAKDALTGKK